MIYADYISTFLMVIIALGMTIWVWIKWTHQKNISNDYKKKYERELHYRKSSEVRLGKIGENLAPFVESWPWNPKDFRFLGNPVDGIQFNDDEIIFIEIKTGSARLSRSQKNFRDLVRKGKVSFVTFKIAEDGCKIID